MNRNRISLFALVALVSTLTWVACESGGKKYTDTYASGQAKIAVDESFQPVIAAIVSAFEQTYPKADVLPQYLSEGEAINLVIQDSARLAVVGRDLNETEREAFQKQTITPKVIKLATDGIALITHPSNPDSMLTMDQVLRILKGQVRTWKELGSPGGLTDSILCVFDRSNSANYNFITQRFGLVGGTQAKLFATQSHAQVRDYVSQHPGALGFIGVNWISDLDDPRSTDFTDQVQVVGLADTINPSKSDYYQPYQAYLALGKYPMTRVIYIVIREQRQGLGNGFTNYACGDSGQRILLKAGLVPGNTPIRIIKTK